MNNIQRQKTKFNNTNTNNYGDLSTNENQNLSQMIHRELIETQSGNLNGLKQLKLEMKLFLKESGDISDAFYGMFKADAKSGRIRENDPKMIQKLKDLQQLSTSNEHDSNVVYANSNVSNDKKSNMQNLRELELFLNEGGDFYQMFQADIAAGRISENDPEMLEKLRDLQEFSTTNEIITKQPLTVSDESENEILPLIKKFNCLSSASSLKKI